MNITFVVFVCAQFRPSMGTVLVCDDTHGCVYIQEYGVGIHLAPDALLLSVSIDCLRFSCYIQSFSKNSGCACRLSTYLMPASYFILAVLGGVAALVVVVGVLAAYMAYHQPRQQASATLGSETGVRPSCK